MDNIFPFYDISNEDLEIYYNLNMPNVISADLQADRLNNNGDN